MSGRELRWTEVRHPRESAALGWSLAALAIALLSGVLISLGWALVIVVIAAVVIRIQQSQMLGNSAMVGPGMFPAVNGLVSRVCRRISAVAPRVHVIQNPALNAFALGFGQPFSVVLHSALIDSLTENELAFVLGHEVGHIVLGHTCALSIVAPFGNIWPIWGWAFGAWSRLAEYSADRAGLMASGDLEAACTALIKIATGPQAAAHADVQGFIRQADRVDQSQTARLGEWFGTHPYVVNRLRNLVSWSRRLDLNSDSSGPSDDSQHSGTATCPGCGAGVLEGAAFCVRCGSELPAETPTEVRCSCGTLAGPDDQYCRDCGAAFPPVEQSV